MFVLFTTLVSEFLYLHPTYPACLLVPYFSSPVASSQTSKGVHCVITVCQQQESGALRLVSSDHDEEDYKSFPPSALLCFSGCRCTYDSCSHTLIQ
ncbi:hypothetical protein BJY52DRAFT_668902 [Lactarius psammicola]|nr:hypothetical protein BJY52DRAFT_668902 [Lactarius psammicola]